MAATATKQTIREKCIENLYHHNNFFAAAPADDDRKRIPTIQQQKFKILIITD